MKGGTNRLSSSAIGQPLNKFLPILFETEPGYFSPSTFFFINSIIFFGTVLPRNFLKGPGWKFASTTAKPCFVRFVSIKSIAQISKQRERLLQHTFPSFCCLQLFLLCHLCLYLHASRQAFLSFLRSALHCQIHSI